MDLPPSPPRVNKLASLASGDISFLSFLTQTLQNLSPQTILMILSIMVGGITGLGIVTFHYLIEFIDNLLLVDLMGVIYTHGAWTLACVPTAGGLIVGLMRWFYPDFGPGIASMVEASQGLKEITALRPITKMIAAAVSLGSGASLGPEAPSVEIGANIGILFAQALRVSLERQRLLLGAGAAAGLAAGFNAPIAGVFFALEVVLGSTFATSSVSVVLLSAVISSLVAQICLGTQPAFALPVYDVRSPWELPLYIGLGVLACCVSLSYKKAIKAAESFFRGEIPGFTGLARLPHFVRPVIGGACVGIAALQWPQVLGVGYETVEAMLQNVDFSIGLLCCLLIVKLMMTAISLGSGLVGGIFAPAMFLGATLGSAYGMILDLIPAIRDHIAGPPAYAMVGMAAVLAGTVKAPLTAILLLFELTRDYRIVLPLMAAVGLSVWLVEVSQNLLHQNQPLNLYEMGVDVDVTPEDMIPVVELNNLPEWEKELDHSILNHCVTNENHELHDLNDQQLNDLLGVGERLENSTITEENLPLVGVTSQILAGEVLASNETKETKENE
jgi:H+/Cl- antiporter ClcA